MSPRLKLMFILTPVTVVVVGGIAGGLWWWYQQQKQLAWHIDRTEFSCSLVQGYIRNAVYLSEEPIDPSVISEIRGPESILPIISTWPAYMEDKANGILGVGGVKEQSGLLIDRWGNPLDCKPPGEGESFPDVWSYGPDGENGTEDDIHGKANED